MDKPKCNMPNCKNNAMNLGNGKYGKLCSSHHKKKYNRPVRGKDIAKKKFLNKVCDICGWEGPCDRHRLLFGQNGGQYVKGNVIILCPNCHRLLHLGKLSLK